MVKTARPIGIFDSGIGGLSVAAAIRELLPNEPLLYVGDSAHVPYGGHDDQLSRRYWGMDRFRVEALEKLLTNGILDDETRAATAAALAEKARILATGADKRGNTEMAARYRRLQRRHGPESAK